MRVRQVGIQRKISIQKFRAKNPGDDWEVTEDARRLREQTEVFHLEQRLIKKQSQKLEKSPDDSDFQSMKAGIALVKLYVSSPKGLGSKVAGTDRDNSVQGNFRDTLIGKYNVAHPEMARTALWCAVTKRYVDVENATAAHIFAYSNGEDMMDAIFGRGSAEPELFSPLNGLILSTSAEQRYDKGLFVIVPELDEDATAHQVNEWHEMQAKPYKIRVVDHEAPNMKKFISPESRKTWADLDGEAVEFRNDYRPRARYLYFHFVCSMLRRAWNKEKKEKILTDQLGKKFWGTPGPYMRRAMLQAFVTEVGHGFDNLLDGAEDGKDVGQESDDTALSAAAQQIYFSNQKNRTDDVDSDDDDTEEES